MNKKRFGIILMSTLLALVVVMGLVPQRASAADYDSSRKGSITVQLQDIGSAMGSVELRCYKVADLLPGTGVYWQTVSALDQYEIDFNNLKSASDYQKTANFLEGKVKKLELDNQRKKTSSTGKAVFSNLEHGVYLIVQTSEARYGYVDAFLAAVPYTSDGKWVYDVYVVSKGESLSETPKTSDQSDILMWSSIAYAAACCMIAVLYCKRRKKNETE